MSDEASNNHSSNFALSSNSSSFSSRSNDIFACLDVLEQKHVAYQNTHSSSSESLEQAGVIKSDPIDVEDDESKTLNIKHEKHRNFIPHHQRTNRVSDRNRTSRPRNYNSDRNLSRGEFRQPHPFRAKRAQVPDFKKHPKNWTCYSLDDVSEKDLSEKTNTRAALDFLMERKNERERQQRLAAGLPAEEEKFETDTAACSKGLISFARNKSNKKKTDDEHYNMLHGVSQDSLREQLVECFSDEADDNSTPTSEPKNLDRGSLNVDEKFSHNPTSTSSSDIGETEGGGTETCFKFKSRKNVRKQIRKRESDDMTDDS